MSTGKRIGGKEAAAKGRFLNHLNFGYAKHIKVREKPSEDALEQMLRTNISKEVIDRYCNGIEFDCMSLHGSRHLHEEPERRTGDIQ